MPLPGRSLVLVTPPVPTSPPLTTFLENYIKTSLATDDVFVPAFLSGVLICGNKRDHATDVELKRMIKTWNPNHSWLCYLGTEDIPAPGPYFLEHETISPAWRIYDDQAAAFSLALRPDISRTGRYLSPSL